MWRRPARLIAYIAAVGALALVPAATAPAAHARTVWLCRPGKAHDPCVTRLATTVFSPTGAVRRVLHPKRRQHRAIDCFYVYPTVSEQKGLQADRHIDPAERSIALYQAARYSQVCRVFAPMYRQLTLAGINAAPARVISAVRSAYRDVRAAWRDYLAHDNHGRGVVLIGHSQGSGMLVQLLRREIDGHRAMRRRLVSALILGGGLTVRRGRDRGGDLRHIRACRFPRQLHCVVGYSTFDGPVPADSRFGRGAGPFAAAFGEPTGPRVQPLCTNPAALRGGAARLDFVQPTTPFAPGTISAAMSLLGLTMPHASTPWAEFPDSYRGRCSTAGGASVLQVTARGGAPLPKPSPDATWGLHLLDANIALGDLVRLVRTEARAYRAARATAAR